MRHRTTRPEGPVIFFLQEVEIGKLRDDPCQHQRPKVKGDARQAAVSWGAEAESGELPGRESKECCADRSNGVVVSGSVTGRWKKGFGGSPGCGEAPGFPGMISLSLFWLEGDSAPCRGSRTEHRKRSYQVC